MKNMKDKTAYWAHCCNVTSDKKFFEFYELDKAFIDRFARN